MATELDARAAGARRLAGKVCVVTGAGQGIGRATARRLGAEGGIVVVADRVAASAEQTTAELCDHGVTATTAIVDLATLAGAQALMTKARAEHGRIDVLVNNVGGTIWIKPYHLYTEDEVKLELERSLHPTLWYSTTLHTASGAP
jgi:NAD(P)-dependent dehydrogenase (short-subunit alcohol dehydrogenase family)